MIRFGIIGAGRIAKRFAKSLTYIEDAKLHAISGRNEKKMMAFREEFPCEKYYLDHDEIISDPDIDAVYISLPNAFHMEYAIKALEAGKAVMCEKPMAGDLSEVRAMVECARKNDVLLMEAMKSRFIPCYREVQNYIERTGFKIRSIDITHGVIVPTDDPARYDVNYGGVIRDIGVYGASWLNSLLDGDYHVTDQHTEYYEGSDKYVMSSISYDSGIECTMEIAYDRKIPSKVVITGEDEIIVVDNMHRPDRYTIIRDGKEEVHDVPYDNDDFFSESDEFCRLMKENRKESYIMPLTSSLEIVEMTDRMRTFR